MCLNYLGPVNSGLGTTVPTAAYSVTVPAGQNLVVVVETSTGGTTCAEFDATLSGFFDVSSGPGACPPVLLSVASRMMHGGAESLIYRCRQPVELSNHAGRYGQLHGRIYFQSTGNNGRRDVQRTGGGTVSNVAFSGNSMIVSLSGVTDQQAGTVTVTNVAGPGSVAVAVRGCSDRFPNWRRDW